MPASNPNATTPAVATARTAGQVTVGYMVTMVIDAFGVKLPPERAGAIIALTTITVTYALKVWEKRVGHALGS